jgi:hypothetical protein
MTGRDRRNGYAIFPLKRLRRIALTPGVHYCFALHYLSIGRTQACLMHALYLHEKLPSSYISALLVGIGYVHRAMQTKFNHRQPAVLAGLLHLSRLGTSDGWSPTSLYNFARALHHLGLRSLALEYYQMVLAHPAKLWIWEAGWNISKIFIESGNLRLARKYLSLHCSS